MTHIYGTFGPACGSRETLGPSDICVPKGDLEALLQGIRTAAGRKE